MPRHILLRPAARFSAILAVLTVSWVQVAAAQPADKQDQARDALRSIRDQLQSSQSLQFVAALSLSSNLRPGTLTGTATFYIKQPNRARVEVKAGKLSQTVIADDQKVIILKPKIGKYAQFPARDSILGNLYVSASLTNISGRMLDFFWVANSDRDIRVKAAPSQTIEGQDCSGLVVERFEERFDVWYRAKGAPLPCKVISHRTSGGAVEVQTTVFKWAENPQLADSLFEFNPAAYKRVDAFDLNY